MTDATPQEMRPAAARARTPGPARVMTALVLREMATTYGRSPGGYAWALMEPLGGILFLTIGFSLLARTPPLGDSFILFYATGMLVLNMYAQNATRVGQALGYNRALLNYPNVTWLDAVVSRFVLTTITATAVAAILLGGSVVWSGHPSSIDYLTAFHALAMTAALGFGIGCLNAVLFGYFPVWRSIWGVVTRPLFIISGVIFLYDDLPRFVQDILWWNPLMHATGLMRRAFYPVYEASYVSPAFVWAVAAMATALGLLFLRQHAVRLLSV
ncbi:MAG: ABC transporter permease [Hasllibacter sp.]